MATLLKSAALAALALTLFVATTVRAEEAQVTELVLWHSYTGAEQKALDETVGLFNAGHEGKVHLTTLPIPYDAMADKLTAAIALGKGPDLFVFAHDRLGDWAAQGLVEPLQYWMDEEVASRFAPSTLSGLSVPQKSHNLYGLPMAVKAVSLVYDADQIAKPPETLEELHALAKSMTRDGRYGFVFDWGNTYNEAGFLHAFGGGVLDDKGVPVIDSEQNAQAVSFVKSLRDEGLLPREVSGALVGSLFNDHKAAMIITGPWALGDIKPSVNFKVALLPKGPAGPMQPYASIEALIMSSRSAHKEEAFEALSFLTSDASARHRLDEAGQPVANLHVWDNVSVKGLVGFKDQAVQAAIPMPSAPAMRHVWTPTDAALSRTFGQNVAPKEALAEAQRRVMASIEASDSLDDEPVAQAKPLLNAVFARAGLPHDGNPDPSAKSATLLRFHRENATFGSWLVDGDERWAHGQTTRAHKPLSDLADRADAAPGKPVVAKSPEGDQLSVALKTQDGRIFVAEAPVKRSGASLALWLTVAALVGLSLAAFIYRGVLAPHVGAYAYIFPACAALVVLIFIPFAYGLSLAFYDVSPTRERLVGLKNFTDILLLRNKGDAHSFYFTFAMTVGWTLVNVALHLVIGLGLALLLQDPGLRFKKVYRVLLIVPWAIPNYITALIWKAMFNAEYGLVNRVLGFGSFSWFERPTTAFLANLATNVWLGFPFMMVTALGALQSIPKELYEAADVDGASRWVKFRTVTLPLLKPALFPAVILGTIWTFNLSFNVIYLVSGGAPDGATDILVTQAFRYAFEQYRYGYAAAYATLIFGILLGYTVLTNRITKATEGAFE